MSARKSDNFRKGTNAEKEWRIGRVAALKARNVPNSECVAYMAR